MSGNQEVKAGAGYMVGNILIKGVSFVSLPIFSRIMSPADYGLYNTYIAYEAIVTIIIGMGLHASIKNAKYDFPGQIGKYVSTQTIITACFSMIILFAIICLNRPIRVLTGLTLIILILLVLQSFGQSMLNIVNAKLALDYNYKTYLKYAAFNTIINVILSVILICVIFSSERFLGRVIGTAAPLIILGCYLFISLCKDGHFTLNKEMALYAAAFGFPLIWHYLAQQVEAQFDRIMITNMIDAASTGIYSFTYSIANIFSILFYSADNVWSVWFFKKMNYGHHGEIRKKANKYIEVITVLCCIMMIGSKEAIMVMGDKEYWESFDLFIPIIWGLFFLFLYTIPVGVQYYYKETKHIASTTAIAALLNIILNYIFIKKLGYIAAAYTTTLSYILMFLMHWFISMNVLNRHGIKNFFYMTDFIHYILVIVILGIMVIFLNPFPIIKYGISIIALAVWGFKNRSNLLELRAAFRKRN